MKIPNRENLNIRSYQTGFVLGMLAMFASSFVAGSWNNYQQEVENNSQDYDHVVQNECFKDGDPYGRQEFTFVSTDGTRHTTKLDHCNIDKERKRLGLKEYEAPAIHEDQS